MRSKPLLYLACLAVLLLIGSSATRAQLTAGFSATPLSGCAPLLVNFSDASAGSPDQWEWDLGNGTTSFFQNPSVTYFNPGTYTVKLTVKKGTSSATEIKTKYITVFAPPVVNFTPSATGGCFPLKVNFTDNSTPGSGSVASYMWDFGDGNTSALQNPGNTYNNAGSYNVSLRVTNSNGCSATLTSPTPIVTHAGVVAGFTTGLASSCQAPASITFTNTSTGTGTFTYNWDFGDGAFSSAVNPTHVYTTAGNYTVKLSTSNNTGCSNTFTQTGLAVGTALANFSAPAISCLNENISFSDLSAPAPQNIFWDFGDGSSSTASQPVHAYTGIGTYTIRLVANFGHCQDTKTKSIQIIPRPVADFSAPVQASCKAPFTAAFASNSPGATAWEWDFGDGATATGANPSHTYTSEGFFTVKLTITNSAGCRETIEKTDFIKIKKPLVQFAIPPQEACIPYSFNPLLYIESVVPITDFQWDFGDGSTGVGISPTHVYTQKGTYTVTLTWKTADGCQETITKTDFVKVGKKVTVDFTANPRLVCASDPILFTDLTQLSTTEHIDRWYWQFGDGGTSDLPTVPYTYSDTGRFSVSLTVWSNGCQSFKTLINYVRILPPIARFKEVIDCSRPYYRGFNNISLVNRLVAPVTYSWDFGDGATSNSEFPSHVYAAQGKYTVTLTVVNGGCSHTTSGQVIITEATMNLTATENAVCPGSSVRFDMQVSGTTANVIAYYWYSDNMHLQNNSNIQAVETYATPGLYTISATIVDTNKCYITRQQQVRVIKVSPDIALPPAVCVNNLVSFTDQSIPEPGFPIVQRVVDYGDGSAAQTNPAALSHTYAKDGNYTITWTVTDSKGCSNSTTKNIIIANPKADFNSPDIMSCTGKNIVFQPVVNPFYSYQWDFGDAQTGAGANPTHQYTNEGAYTVSLLVEDQYGCKASITKNAYIQINNPVALFDINVSQSNCPPLVVTFSNQSLNMLSAEWDFGDGNTSTLSNPVHFYTYPGDYWPLLKITSKGGCTSIIQNKKITINGPRGKFDYDNKLGCVPVTVNFTGVTNDNVSFTWDFNNGATNVTALPATTYVYTKPGRYLPKMILEEQGCKVPITGPDVIEVFDVTAAFQTDVQTLCDRGVVRFEDISVSNDLITGYLWKLGDGTTATANTFPHQYTVVGDYPIELEVTTLHNCKSTVTLPVPIRVRPSPLAGITGPTEACVPIDFQFTGHLLNANPYTLTWAWDFGNGQTASAQAAPLANYTKAGNYNVKLTITNPFQCSNTAVYPILIHPLPDVDAGNNIVVCRGTPRQLQPTGATSYTWSSAGDLSCTHCTAPVINPVSTIKYYVEGESDFGCRATDSLLVTVQQRFEVTAEKGDTLCLGEAYKLQAAGADSYSWTPAAGLDNAGIAGPVAQPQVTTLYRVIGKDNNNCFADTAFVPIVVYPYPQITLDDKKTVIVGTSVTLTPLLSSDVNSIRWKPPTWLSCADCPAPLATPTQTIQYKLQVANQGGCVTEQAITLFVVCGGENMFLPNTFSPNGDGVNDVFYPMGKGIAHIKNFRVFNRWGEVVFDQYAFQANDISKGWNGKIKGTLASPDVFVYVIDVICGNGQELIFKGDVTLIR